LDGADVTDVNTHTTAQFVRLSLEGGLMVERCQFTWII